MIHCPPRFLFRIKERARLQMNLEQQNSKVLKQQHSRNPSHVCISVSIYAFISTQGMQQQHGHSHRMPGWRRNFPIDMPEELQLAGAPYRNKTNSGIFSSWVFVTRGGRKLGSLSTTTASLVSPRRPRTC
jgi:hypothetical protein